MNTHIKSLIGKKVRIKREFIKFKKNKYYTCTNSSLNTFVENPNEAIFSVLTDMYGVDLFPYRYDGFEIGSVEPTHQVIIEVIQGCNKISYPFLWDAKYFEEVREETIVTKIYHPITEEITNK